MIRLTLRVGRLLRRTAAWIIWPIPRSERTPVVAVLVVVMLVCGSHFIQFFSGSESLAGGHLTSSGPPDWLYALIGLASVFIATVQLCRLIFVVIFRAVNARPKIVVITTVFVTSLALFALGLGVNGPAEESAPVTSRGGVAIFSSPGVESLTMKMTPDRSFDVAHKVLISTSQER